MTRKGLEQGLLLTVEDDADSGAAREADAGSVVVHGAARGEGAGEDEQGGAGQQRSELLGQDVIGGGIDRLALLDQLGDGGGGAVDDGGAEPRARGDGDEVVGDVAAVELASKQLAAIAADKAGGQDALSQHGENLGDVDRLAGD
jgi:hypothetical protein